MAFRGVGLCAYCVQCLTRVLTVRSAGVGRTGVFITLSIVLERMRYEGVVDLFQTVKTLRTQRPAMVQTEVCCVVGRGPGGGCGHDVGVAICEKGCGSHAKHGCPST